MDKKIKAVIFDLNGVFIQGPYLSELFAKDFGVAKAIFLPVLKSVMSQVRQPNAPRAYELWLPYLKDWGVGLNEQDFYKYWFGSEKEVPEMVSLADDLKMTSVKVYILSNNFKERSQYYDENFPFLKKYDGVYYSWQTGYVKPDKRAYTNMMSENNLTADECVYFDDSDENIEPARSLGFNAYKFHDANSTRKILNLK